MNFLSCFHYDHRFLLQHKSNIIFIHPLSSILVIGLGKLDYPMAEFLSSSQLNIKAYDTNKNLINKLKKDV